MVEPVDRNVMSDHENGRTPQEIRMLVLKLRWIGQDDEAEELASRLAAIAPSLILSDIGATD